MRHPYLPSPSQTIPEPSAGTFPRPAGAAPSPGPAGPPLSAVLNGARAEGLGRGGGRDSYPSPVPQGWGKSPSVESGWGTACPTSPPPPSAISSLLGGSSPVLPGTGEEKIEPGRGGEIYIYIKWVGAAWNRNQCRCSLLPKSEGQTSFDLPRSPVQRPFPASSSLPTAQAPSGRSLSPSFLPSPPAPPLP